MLVKAAPGLKCPTETNPREYITDIDPIDVPDTTYYRRLLDDGSLIPATIGKTKGDPK